MSNKCYRADKNGWNYIKIEGKPFERGVEYGKLMSKEIIESIEIARKLAWVELGMEWDFFKTDEMSILHHWKKCMEQDPFTEFLDEIKGMAAGVNEVSDTSIDVDDLILWNGQEELMDYWFPTVADKIYAKLTGEKCDGTTYNNFHKGADDHCSAFIATGSYTSDGRIVMAHNSFTPFETGNFLNVIVKIVPENGNEIVMQSEPGYIHSMSDFYETKTGEGKGLMITETTIGGFNAYDDKGIPEFIRIRYAVQYARTMDEFVSMFWNGNNGGYANTWMLGDIESGEIMRFEAGLKFYKVDRTNDGYFAGFNAPLDPRIRNFETTNSGFADIRRHQGSRQVRIPQLVEQYKGKIDNETAQIILADHYDVYLEKDNNPCSRTVCSHYEFDDRASMSQPGRPLPYQPRGAVDGVTSTAADAEQLMMWGRWGSSCGMPFSYGDFIKKHPQFDYLTGLIKDRPHQEWTKFGE